MPKTHDSSQKILGLSPMDCVFVGPGSYPIEFAFFYENVKISDDQLNNLEHAWQDVAMQCPVLRSHLARDEGRYVFSWNESSSKAQPISFVRTETNVHPDLHSNPYDLISPVTTKPTESLAKIKITEGIDGTTLGFSLSHAIADGFTYFMVLGAIARMANPKTAREPMVTMNHERHRLFEMTAIATDQSILGLSKSDLRQDTSRSSIRYWKKHYSAKRLQELYQKFSDSPKRLSTNDMICAELWREFALEFDRDGREFLSLVAPVDYRRLYPEFPKNYAGNAVALSRLDLSRNDVVHMSPVELAQKIRLMVQQVDQRYVETTNAGLAANLGLDDWAGLGEYHIVDPTAGLLITNLSRLPLATLDFGAGAPTYCRPLTPCRRTIVLLSDGQDGIIAHIHG